MFCYQELPIAKRDCPESEYTGFSYALSEALLIMERLMEMRKREVKVVTNATTKCNVYKDNSEDTGNGKTQKYR